MANKVSLYNMPAILSQEQRINHGLKLLGLEGILSSYKIIAQKAINEHLPPHDFLESLLEKELSIKEEKRRISWTQGAKFPWKKTLVDFDFFYNSGIDKTQINELASCRFIEHKENVIFLGQVGVGKTHLAVALGLEAISKGFDVLFFTLEHLIEQIEKAEQRGRLPNLFASLMRTRLLILDEFDWHEVNSETSRFLFNLLSRRYEHGSVVITSNQSFEEWDVLFGSRIHADKIRDRIIHHGAIVTITGDSYRIKDKRI